MQLFLPFCAAVLCAGVAVGRYCTPHGALVLMGACVACGVALAWARRLPALATGALLLATAAAGVALGARAWSRHTPACHVSLHTGRQAVRLQATVAGRAVVTRAGRRATM